MYLVTYPNGSIVIEAEGGRVVSLLLKDRNRRAFEISVDADGLSHIGPEAFLGGGTKVAEIIQHELLLDGKGVAVGSITNQVGEVGEA